MKSTAKSVATSRVQSVCAKQMDAKPQAAHACTKQMSDLKLQCALNDAYVNLCRSHVSALGAIDAFCICSLVFAQSWYVTYNSIQDQRGAHGAGVLPLQKCCWLR